MVGNTESRGPAKGCCAIIPAFNEADRVGNVVSVAVSSGLFSEIVVVDDGSTDATGEHAAVAGAEVISLRQNQGKPAAMLNGLNGTSAAVVCFLDADLLNVTPNHLQLLVEPVAQGTHEAVLAVFSGGRLATTLAQRIAPMISGHRCLRRELLDNFDSWKSGFGIETAINNYLSRFGIEQKIIYWEGAAHVMKEEKRGFITGALSRMKMYGEIAATWIASKFNW